MKTRKRKQKPVLAWHFVPADMRLQYGDSRLVRRRTYLMSLAPKGYTE